MIHNDERLLLKLVEEYHGTVPWLTAKVLLHHGSILMKRALSYTSLSQCDFQRGVDILARCGYVKITELGRQRLLEVNPHRIANILYYPYYLAIVGKRYGVESQALLKSLFLYGNLSINDLLERTLYHIIQTNSLDIIDEQIKHFIDSLHAKFEELYSNKIIVLVDSRRGDLSSYDINSICEALKKNLDNKETSNKEWIGRCSLLTFNINALNYLLFVELFPYFLNQPFANKESEFVFKMLLELTFEKTFSIQSATLTFSEIYERYRAQYPATNITKLSSTLNWFSHFFAPNFVLVDRVSCSLNFEYFLEDIVKIIIKEFIKKNYGENSVRIFGALLEEVCINESTLLNSLKMDTKELHRNLYVLDMNRMINITMYSETNQSNLNNARNVKKAFSVSLNDVVDCIIKRCYYSIYTMRHRRHIEINDQKDLIARKSHIENYKKEIGEQQLVSEEDKILLVRTAHNYMSDVDHKRAETMLTYDNKVDKVEFHLINYIFILNLWKGCFKNSINVINKQS